MSINANNKMNIDSTINGDDYQSIYFIRHAHKQDLKHQFDCKQNGAMYWPRPCDTPLSYEGSQMAHDLGKFFRNNNNNKHKIDTIVVSPALRCLQTANPISEAFCGTGTGTAALQMNIEEGLFDVPIGSLLATSSLSSNNGNDSKTKPPNADAWDYPYLPFPTIEERKCYFPNINTEYKSKISVDTFDETNYTTNDDDIDHTVFYQHELQAYVNRASRTIDMILDEFTNDNICIVTHGAHIPIMIGTLLDIDMKTTLEKIMGGTYAHMASITRIYRKKEMTITNGPWMIDTELANSVNHLTQNKELLHHKGLPRYTGNPAKYKLFMSILTNEMSKSPWLLTQSQSSQKRAHDDNGVEQQQQDGLLLSDDTFVKKSKM